MAVDLGHGLVRRRDLQEDLLHEAHETGEEAGFTVCGRGKVKSAVSTAFSSVILPFCPLDSRAVMHGGGGHDLASPRLSLLDISDVLFGTSDASLVVGADTSELMVAPNREQLLAAQRVFRDAVGLNVGSHEDMVHIVEERLISVEEARQARQHIKTELAPLFSTESTPHPDMLPAATAAAQAASAGAVLGCAWHHRNDNASGLPPAVLGAIQLDEMSTPARQFGNILTDTWAVLTTIFSFDPEKTEINILALLASSVADAFVLFLLLKLFGASPRELARQMS